MASSEQAVENINVSNMIEQFGKTLHELKAFKDASEDRVQWTEVEEHFRNLESVLKGKCEELEAREKEYKEEEAETRALLVEREAAVVAEEQDLLDRIQVLKDDAVAVIAEARANHQPIHLESTDGGDNKDTKVSSSIGHTNSLEEYSPINMAQNDETLAADAKPRPELTQFCEQMDAKGLLSFTKENQKNLFAIREELSFALESASEPARLVLDSLEGFYPSEITQPTNERDAALQGMRKSCIMFMEAMAALLARINPGSDHLINPEIRQQAKAIADEWKPKLASAGNDATNGNSLEAEAFLQLLSTFRIASEFDEEELCKLVLVIAHRRQAPELCRSLGLAPKMPGIVESLVDSGKLIDAVRFIHAFQLTESFPPVPLLKTYLKDLRRNSQGKSGNYGGATGAQSDGNALELAALRAVIRCVEDYKLETDYPLDSLQKRLSQLERSKSDKKRAGGDYGRHHQAKKSRPNRDRGHRGFRGGAAPVAAGGWQAPPAFVERTPYHGLPDRYGLPDRNAHGAPNPYEYQVPNHSAVYGQQTADQRMYFNPQDDRTTAGTYSAGPASYGGYVGNGMRSTRQPYM